MGSSFVNLYGSDLGFGVALRHLQGNNARTGTDVEDIFCTLAICPRTEQYAIGADLHRHIVLLNGKLLETKTAHCLMLFQEALDACSEEGVVVLYGVVCIVLTERRSYLGYGFPVVGVASKQA